MKLPKPCVFCCKLCWHGFAICKICRSELLKRKPLRKLRFGSHELAALMLWNTKNENIVRHLIYQLKGGARGNLGEELGRLLADHWVQFYLRQQIPKNLVVVPAPPRRNGPFNDHAYFLAKGVSDRLQLPMCQLLERSCELGNQRSLPKKERKKRKLVALTSISPTGVLFVDDVVTSGSTAIAGFEALKRPRYFKVLALAYRPLLLLGGSSVIKPHAPS